MPPPTTRPPHQAVTTATAARLLGYPARGSAPRLRSSRCRRSGTSAEASSLGSGGAGSRAASWPRSLGMTPMSYALNFEDDRSRESDEEFPARNFSARLPVSPDRLLPTKMPREVLACS
ncbi:hypothetical protein NL676_035313 [Syzygium grande]|nr:hypothetical protein NL676_035313 [Syzygium grande]